MASETRCSSGLALAEVLSAHQRRLHEPEQERERE